MRKVKLEVESLVVESFNTCSDRELKGTVVGHNVTEGFDETCEGAGCLGYTWYWDWTCNGRGTCFQGCMPEEKEDDFHQPSDAACSQVCTGWGCPP